MDPVEQLETRLRLHPDDWPSWLVYADRLTDQGDVRGELIALEHCLATAALTQGEHDALVARTRALKEAHHPQWRQGLTVPDAHLQWQHGFVVGLFPRGGEVTETLAAVSAHPSGRLLVRLGLKYFQLGDEAIAELVASGALSRVVSLDLAYNGLGPAAATALATSEALPSLVRLDLSSNPLGEQGVAALAEARLPALTELLLNDVQPGHEGVRALCGSSRRLTRLSLMLDALDDDDAEALAQSEAFGALSALNLGTNQIGNRGARALADSRGFGALSMLELAGNPIGSKAEEALRRSEGLRGCRILL